MLDLIPNNYTVFLAALADATVTKTFQNMCSPVVRDAEESWERKM